MSSYRAENEFDAPRRSQIEEQSCEDNGETSAASSDGERTASQSSGPSTGSFGGDIADGNQEMAPVDPRFESTLTQRATTASAHHKHNNDEIDSARSIDFSESVTSEERRLLQEIEEDARRDEELEDAPRSRAALMASPLVQAAAAALAAASSRRISEPSGSTRWGSKRFSSQQSDHHHENVAHSDHTPSSLVSSEEDERGAFRSEVMDEDEYDDDPHLEQYQASMGLDLGTIPEQEDYPSYRPDARKFEDKHVKARRRKRRRALFILGWVVAIGLIAASVSIVIIRLRDDGDGTTSAPTASPAPTVTKTASPTREPTFRTRSPTAAPSSSPLSPIASPTAAPSSTTVSPTGIGTVVPTVSATQAPTFAGDGEQRRIDITSMCIQISGVLKLMDTSSPQFAACQWILNDDSMQLLVSDKPTIQQRYVLAVLYYSTNVGNSWIRCGQTTQGTPCDSEDQRFLAGTSECLWLGMSCSEDGYVKGVNLRENGLKGELPREVGEMPRLESLIFSRNDLSSTIPSILGRLQNLRVLLLNQNQLTGSIPLQFATLRAIWYLHLGNNQIRGTIPPEIFVRSLQHLDLGDNLMVGTLPPTLREGSPSLINIDVGNNRLTGPLPSELGTLSLLQSFTADNNTFSGSLSGSLFMPSMTVFDVSHNLLDGQVPEELFDYGTSLTLLNLGHNSMLGNISRRFSELTNLEQLILWNNDFFGTVPSRLGLLTKLEVLHLGETNLEGTMPEEICDLRAFPLRILSADCDGNPPELECDCCSVCFPSGV